MFECRDHGDGRFGLWERNPMQAVGELRARVERLDVQHATLGYWAVLTLDRTILSVFNAKEDALKAAENYVLAVFRAKPSGTGLAGYGA